jgi:glycosyltransferase involved in cell wall biosynthesis
MTKPFLSIVVVCYRMNRELPRTLFSLTPTYQRGITKEEFEVIVVDNGSPEPPTLDQFAHLDLDLSIHHMVSPTKSPVDAINFGLNRSCGSVIGVFIDGARIVSPGLLAMARDLIVSDDRHVVGSRGRYLGDNWQRHTKLRGYNQEVEDRLLSNSGWTEDGYRLFDCSVFDESSGPTWFDPVTESNTLFMSRSFWVELGGFDRQFTSAGGGLVNLDMWRRACEHRESIPTLLLGEASFHQFHGGVATNGEFAIIDEFFTEYRQIRGREFEAPTAPMKLVGTFVHLPPNKEMAQPEFEINKTASRTGPRAVSKFARVMSRSLKRRLVRTIRWTKYVLRFDAAGMYRDRAAIESIRESEFFDSSWYVTTYPEVARAGWDPAEHYFLYGASERRNPGPDFNSAWYSDQYRDVDAFGVNPLLHYLHHGRGEGRRIRKVSDTESGPGND